MILPLFFGASLFFLICTAGLPFRISPSAGISAVRFAPRSQQSLAASFRGAKSSQKFCAAICLRRHFRGAICSPLLANPCAPSRGAKSSQRFRAAACPAADISAARFAPRSQQSLAASFRGAKSSQKFCAAICLRRLFQRRDLLPAPCKALRLRSGEQNLHRDSAPPSASGDLFRGAICSPPPAKPCGFVWGAKSSQKFRAGACHRRLLLALSRRQTLISPSGHANRAPKIPPGGRPCWRCPAGKRLYHRRATPTGRPESRPAADPVGAAPPAKP